MRLFLARNSDDGHLGWVSIWSAAPERFQRRWKVRWHGARRLGKLPVEGCEIIFGVAPKNDSDVLEIEIDVVTVATIKETL